MSKIIEASKILNDTPKHTYIHVSIEFVQKSADERGVSFDEMIKIMEDEFNGKIEI